MRFVLLDFETASAANLKKTGAWKYAEDPTTEVLCLGFTIDGGLSRLVHGQALQYGYSDVDLEEAARTPGVIFIAHNVQFEKAIWRNQMIPLGWPALAPERWHDTQAVCAMKGIPLGLDKALQALRLGAKDTEGRAVTIAMSKTNRKGYYDRAPAKMQRVFEYCQDHDVPDELELHRRIRGLGASERRVWLLDQEINHRGVRIDLEFVAAAQAICDQASEPLRAEFKEITGIEKTGSPKFKEWVLAAGVDLPDMRKETIDKLLGEDDEADPYESLAGDQDDDWGDNGWTMDALPDHVRRALEIRRVLGSASIKKLAAMRNCCSSDGRAHGLLQYHGAGPGRWAGRLLQPQNFPRPSLKTQIGWNKDGTEKFAGHDVGSLVAAIGTGDAEWVRSLFGEPIEAVANALRHALVPAEGYRFEVGDFAQIEARGVMGIAGQHDMCDLMAAGQSPYIPMAESIFKRKIDKHVDIKEYTIGKNTVLGCGFQMGWRKFRARYCPDESEEFAKDAINAYRQDKCPKVPKLWEALEDAAVRTVWDRVPHEAYGIQYALEDGWLTCRLPSGRKLWYYDPRPVRKAMPWDPDDIRPGYEYSAWKAGRWKRVSAYGGLLTENVVQATARDMLVNAMFACEQMGHPVVLTVHDEIVTEVPEAYADAKLLEHLMTDQPDWVKALRIPVAAECATMERYRK